MANWNDNRTRQDGIGVSPSQTGDVTGRTSFDAGLRKHMLSIYNYMASGVLLTGIMALLFVNSPFFELAFATVATPQGTVLQPTALGWIIQLSPLAFMAFWWFKAQSASEMAIKVAFWGFCVAFGLSLSTIFLVYTGASIAATFFATAGAFAGLSLFGYTTQKDLSGWGSFLIMGVIGLIIASVINIFLGSGTFDLAISFLGVLIFAGLTAYDTQRLKTEYLTIQQIKMTNPTAAAAYPMGKVVVMGALSLYLDFINMFLFLLRFMGVARD